MRPRYEGLVDESRSLLFPAIEDSDGSLYLRGFVTDDDGPASVTFSVDGGLVGGASLKPDFGAIVNYNK